jgi:hypothetical protein
MKLKLGRFFHHTSNKKLSDNFTQWSQFWRDSVGARREAAMLEELNAVKDARVKTFVKKMTHSRILAGWAKWTELLETTRGIRCAVGRMQNRQDTRPPTPFLTCHD